MNSAVPLHGCCLFCLSCADMITFKMFRTEIEGRDMILLNDVH